MSSSKGSMVPRHCYCEHCGESEPTYERHKVEIFDVTTKEWKKKQRMRRPYMYVLTSLQDTSQDAEDDKIITGR